MNDKPSFVLAMLIAAIVVVVVSSLAYFAVQQMPSEASEPVQSLEEGVTEAPPVEDATQSENADVQADAPAEPSEPDPQAVAEEPSETESNTTGADTEAGADTADLEVSTEPSELDEAQAESEGITETVMLTETVASTDTVVVETAEGAEGATTEPQTVSEVAIAPPVVTDELIEVFAMGGCIACHVIPEIPAANGPLGPDLSNIGVDATTRIEGYTAEAYIRESILNPTAFIVPDCPNGPCPADLMLPIYADPLSEAQIDEMVGYLLALNSSQSIELAEAVTEPVVPDSEGDIEEPATEEPIAEESTDQEPAVDSEIDLAAVSAAITKGTCGACHVIPDIEGAVGALGPNLANIGTDAATRVAGYTAEEYLRESILEPNAFIAPKCPTGDCIPGIMLPNLVELLTEEEIDMVIGYLATLREGS